ncbi:MAG: hypothetical protein HZC02_04380 [Candidatus Levybacteria bacterium]|nr:hypothetical protein [Candidatus Levybacteria bacterium]
MKILRSDLAALLCILLFSALFVSDLFISKGLPTTFDNPFHTTNITQFFLAIKDGDFPVRWSDGFGNYGLPIPIVAHQLTSYLGALQLFLGMTPEISLKILYFLGVFFSALFFYIFMRLYVQRVYALVSTFMLTFSSYRIFDVYVRGALPEVFSGIFLPTILIGSFLYIKKQKIAGFYLVMISVFLLALNHPMMLFLYSFIFVPYIIWLLLADEKITISTLLKTFTSRKAVILVFSGCVGVMMASFYLIPLTKEIKYFYFGHLDNPFNKNSFLSLANIFSNTWPYFTDKEISPRGHVVLLGLVESFLVLFGAIILIIEKFKKKGKIGTSLLFFAILECFFLLFIMSPFASTLFTSNKFLGNIQFQWRILSVFIFIPPIILGYSLSKFHKNSFVIVAIVVISFISFPQIYGKNYQVINEGVYYFTPYNVHSIMMNTIWTGKTEEYPVRGNKSDIIDGKGKIDQLFVLNSKRAYQIDAKTPLRLVDYTFYFPGWQVSVDGSPSDIEFQDPQFRGVITYHVPQGKHKVLIEFKETKLRLFADIISMVGLMLFIMLLFLKNKINRFIS